MLLCRSKSSESTDDADNTSQKPLPALSGLSFTIVFVTLYTLIMEKGLISACLEIFSGFNNLLTRSSTNAKRTAQPLQKYLRGTPNVWELP